LKKNKDTNIFQTEIFQLDQKILKNIMAPVSWNTEKVSIHRRPSIFNASYDFTQEPAVGSLVYCQLATAEHSGIYIGNRNVVELNGKGEIKQVSLKQFTGNIFSTDKDIFIPVLKCAMFPIGNEDAAEAAIKNLSGRRKYHLLDDNCHQFAAGCIMGNLENDCNFLFMVKEEFIKSIHFEESDITWVRWKWYLD